MSSSAWARLAPFSVAVPREICPSGLASRFAEIVRHDGDQVDPPCAASGVRHLSIMARILTPPLSSRAIPLSRDSPWAVFSNPASSTPDQNEASAVLRADLRAPNVRPPVSSSMLAELTMLVVPAPRGSGCPTKRDVWLHMAALAGFVSPIRISIPSNTGSRFSCWGEGVQLYKDIDGSLRRLHVPFLLFSIERYLHRVILRLVGQVLVQHSISL